MLGRVLGVVASSRAVQGQQLQTLRRAPSPPARTSPTSTSSSCGRPPRCAQGSWEHRVRRKKREQGRALRLNATLPATPNRPTLPRIAGTHRFAVFLAGIFSVHRAGGGAGGGVSASGVVGCLRDRVDAVAATVMRAMHRGQARPPARRLAARNSPALGAMVTGFVGGDRQSKGVEARF